MVDISIRLRQLIGLLPVTIVDLEFSDEERATVCWHRSHGDASTADSYPSTSADVD